MELVIPRVLDVVGMDDCGRVYRVALLGLIHWALTARAIMRAWLFVHILRPRCTREQHSKLLAASAEHVVLPFSPRSAENPSMASNMIVVFHRRRRREIRCFESDNPNSIVSTIYIYILPPRSGWRSFSASVNHRVSISSCSSSFLLSV